MQTILALFLCICFIVTGTAWAETYDTTWRYPVITIPRLVETPAIDGTINEAEWAQATLFPELVEMDPGHRVGLPPRQKTRIWMGYTNDAIYMAFRQDLPPEALPEVAIVTNQRDLLEVHDNAVGLFLSDLNHKEQFNISFNSASQTYDRRLDTPLYLAWDPKMIYRARTLATGWEGEVKIPFAEFELQAAPEAGTQWQFVLHSFWRRLTGSPRLFSFPLSRWRANEQGRIIFGGDTAAIRFDGNGGISVVGGSGTTSNAVRVQKHLLHRPERAKQSYYQQVATATAVGQVEGGTLQTMEQIISDAIAPFKPVESIQGPGEYLLRYDVRSGERVLASGVQSYYKAAPIELDVIPRYLSAGLLSVSADTDLNDATIFKATLEPQAAIKSASTIATQRSAPIKSSQGNIDIPVRDLPVGQYQLTADVSDDTRTLAKTTMPVTKPAPPDWWTMKEGLTPLVPPPWKPIVATEKDTQLLTQHYTFNGQPVPSKIVTKGQDLLAGPAHFLARQPFKAVSWKMKSSQPDTVVYESENVSGNLTMKATTAVEFDGFMRIDLDLTGTGQTDQLDLVIPFKKEHAILLTNYVKASGPGTAPKPNRFTNLIPAAGHKSPPMITTWIGTDYYGLEFSCESSRGWAMAKPNEAMEVVPDGDQVLLKIHLISKAIPLSEKPRRITFGLIGTPTKTLSPFLQKARFYDDVTPYLLPIDWSGHSAWHPPVKDPAIVTKAQGWIKPIQQAGTKVLVNGGWAISTTASEWEVWGKEMTAAPIRNVSFSTAKQFAYCYNTPYSTFLANSFGYNARLIGFDGIRFDTVIPSYECNSLYHRSEHGDVCGWYDDDGNLWPSYSNFSLRETMKRLYRIFHGGVIQNGAIELPNAGPPLMAVHSFTDRHEIGEGFYMHAKTLKEGYDPGLVRALMAGSAFGVRTENSIKEGPLIWNERIGALLLGGAEPRFENYNGWKPGYEAHANPAPSIWDAWEWVDRWNAQFLGWWNNSAYVQIDKPDNAATILASFYHNPATKRVLLTVTNYEKDRPFNDLGVKLDLVKLGFTGPVYAEDAITLEPIDLDADGSMKLDILGQRYRLIQISQTPARYREEVLGPDLLADLSLPNDTEKEWVSPEVKVEPGSSYVLSALVKIDETLGADTTNPNAMGPFTPAVRHYLSFRFSGQDINGIAGSNKRALSKVGDNGTEFIPYATTAEYRSKFAPQLWEKTGGWTRVFVPIRAGETASTMRIIWGNPFPQLAQVKNIELKKVNP